MFYNKERTIQRVEEDPSLIFGLIGEGHYELVDKLLLRKKVDINLIDNNGNSILMQLLRHKQYDLVLKYIKRKEVNINHQNHMGDTISHIVSTINYKYVIGIIKEIKKKKEFLPNIKNNNNETILDKAVKNNYVYTAIKILEDKRFTNIDIISFKNLYETFVKGKEYGKYTRYTNLEIIVDNLEKKVLLPKVKEIISFFENNKNIIKEEILGNRTYQMDRMLNSLM